MFNSWVSLGSRQQTPFLNSKMVLVPRALGKLAVKV